MTREKYPVVPLSQGTEGTMIRESRRSHAATLRCLVPGGAHLDPEMMSQAQVSRSAQVSRQPRDPAWNHMLVLAIIFAELLLQVGFIP